MPTKHFTLMIPGPSMPEPEVLSSLSLPTLPHYGSVWKEVHESAKAKLRSVFRTSSNEIIILPAPGQAAVEMAVANFVMRGEKAFVCLNGYFSEVIVEIIRSYGGVPIPIKSPRYGASVTPESVREVVEETKDHEGKSIFVVHNETSTGAVNPANEILQVAHENGLISILDSISSFGGMDTRVDEWKADFCVGYASKGIGGICGVTPVSISQNCWVVAKKNADRIPSRFLNLNVWREFIDLWGPWGHAHPCSMPTELVVALNTALDLVLEEGLDNRYRRHRDAASQMRRGLEAMGLPLFPDRDCLSDTLTVASVEPEWEGRLRSELFDRYNIMIAGGLDKLAGKIVRIAHMGTSATSASVLIGLDSIAAVLRDVRPSEQEKGRPSVPS
jgi:aspartate aminotransferase-like enzyme